MSIIAIIVLCILLIGLVGGAAGFYFFMQSMRLYRYLDPTDIRLAAACGVAAVCSGIALIAWGMTISVEAALLMLMLPAEVIAVLFIHMGCKVADLQKDSRYW